jgi:NSS family neurotransmitter:Na+ symporter
MATAPREHWSSRTGFVLAAVGSAVGLGNMWRFSYLAAENGGAAFVVFYLLVTLVVGIPVLLAELVIGRGSQRSPIRALAHFGGRAWTPLGAIFVAAGFLILSYYGVIAGWTVRYALIVLFEGFGPGIADRFGEVATGWDAFAYHVGFMALTIAVVAGGIRGGIERTALVLMPTLFAIVVGLALYAATLDGAGPGYRYYLEFEFEKLLHWSVVRDAAGQAFFSLSLGMGAMLTFASYLRRDEHLPNASLTIGFADVGVAFVAGLVVFPLIFALGLEEKVVGSTVGALFITLPQAFAEMGAAGRFVGFLFFAALVVGALTSAISLLEVVVASAVDGLGWSRHQAALVAGAAITLLGAPSAWNTDVLGLIDQVANNFFLLGGGLGLAIFVGWIMRDPIAEAAGGTDGIAWFPLWRWLLRIAVPIFLVLVLFYAVPETLIAAADLFASLTGG